eukprot:GHVU01142570.1.p1 GENE.GHVU01142570.1~~GHVU01142570.1.p1  ORF type:complete len:143 (-),score=36.98 GHVU01142570.1:994-1380(-)
MTKKKNDRLAEARAQQEMQQAHHIAELKAQLANLRLQLSRLQGRTQDSKINKKRAEAALEELLRLPSDANVYSQVSRVFVKKTMEDLKAEQTTIVADCERDLRRFDDVEKGLMSREERLKKEVAEAMK